VTVTTASRITGWFGIGRTGSSRHRDVGGSSGRAAVLGAGDGLLTNVSLILGVAGASPGAATVRLAGIAGLLAGAFSMAAGELVSVRAQDELVQHEVDVERHEIADDPMLEREELAGMYRLRGVPPADADTVARILMATDVLALDTHARLELGVNPLQPGSANRAAVASFGAFALGALLPLLPWFVLSGAAAVVASVVIAAVAALVLGWVIGRFSAQSGWRTAVRQLAVGAVAASVTFAVGRLLGGTVA